MLEGQPSGSGQHGFTQPLVPPTAPMNPPLQHHNQHLQHQQPQHYFQQHGMMNSAAMPTFPSTSASYDFSMDNVGFDANQFYNGGASTYNEAAFNQFSSNGIANGFHGMSGHYDPNKQGNSNATMGLIGMNGLTNFNYNNVPYGANSMQNLNAFYQSPYPHSYMQNSAQLPDLRSYQNVPNMGNGEIPRSYSNQCQTIHQSNMTQTSNNTSSILPPADVNNVNGNNSGNLLFKSPNFDSNNAQPRPVGASSAELSDKNLSPSYKRIRLNNFTNNVQNVSSYMQPNSNMSTYLNSNMSVHSSNNFSPATSQPSSSHSSMGTSLKSSPAQFSDGRNSIGNGDIGRQLNGSANNCTDMPTSSNCSSSKHSISAADLPQIDSQQQQQMMALQCHQQLQQSQQLQQQNNYQQQHLQQHRQQLHQQQQLEHQQQLQQHQQEQLQQQTKLNRTLHEEQKRQRHDQQQQLSIEKSQQVQQRQNLEQAQQVSNINSINHKIEIFPPNGVNNCANINKNNSAVLDERKMLKYLQNPSKYDCIVTIFHSKVAQKSYGNEKRHFTPPPTVYLHGGGWRRQRRRLDAQIAAELSPQYPLSIEYQQQIQQFNAYKNNADVNAWEGPSTSASAFASSCLKSITNKEGGVKNNNDELTHLVAFFGISDLRDQKELLLDFSKHDYAAAKSIFIKDEARRKYLTLKLNIFYEVLNGPRHVDVGLFESFRTKVISKPAKKKTTKNSDWRYQSIVGGTKVALFNRVRSQALTTRFLDVENDTFSANSNKWGAFYINLIDTNNDQTKLTMQEVEFLPLEGTIHYNDVIMLTDSASRLSLPPLIIRKVEKSGAALNTHEKEPVNQLHKCAFQMLDEPQNYICHNNELIEEFPARLAADSLQHHVCPDGASWVITSVHTTEYRFYESLPRSPDHRLQVGPVPLIKNLKLVGDETQFARLLIDGQNFGPMLTVWLGSTSIEMFKWSKQTMSCVLPPLSSLNLASATMKKSDDTDYKSAKCRKYYFTFPISFARHDGVIYGTTATVNYCCVVRYKADNNNNSRVNDNFNHNINASNSNDDTLDAEFDSEALARAVPTSCELGDSQAFSKPALINVPTSLDDESDGNDD